MITAVILVNVERSMLSEVMKEILAVDGIVEVHSVVGEYDLAAVARVATNQQLSTIISDKMCSQIKGITHTKTLVSLDSKFKYNAASVYGVD